MTHMSHKRQITRDITYAHSAQTRRGQVLIRALENATGRMGLIKRADGYEAEVAQGRDFWEVMVNRYGLSLNLVAGKLDNIPSEGPMVMISNHPYGILDGLMMGHILSKRRQGDFRILANSVFRKAEELNKILLPISFDETKEAIQQNIATRKEALDYLGQGGAIGVFPGGTVSTSLRPFSNPMDPGWRGFTARMITKSNAAVIPVFFDGCTSRLFQLASRVHNNLRLGLLIKEFKKRVDTPVDVVIGSPIPRADIDLRSKDTRELMDYLRNQTYALSPCPLKDTGYGFEFEDKHKQ